MEDARDVANDEEYTEKDGDNDSDLDEDEEDAYVSSGVVRVVVLFCLT